MKKEIVEKYILPFGTLFICCGLYAYLFWSLDRGISSDEGWYYFNFLTVHNTPLSSGLSDFGIIISKYFSFLDFENALQLRYFYLALSIGIMAVFAFSSYAFLQTINRQFCVSKVQYIASVYLLFFFSYYYTTPVLFYDTLNLLLFLLVFSFLFLAEKNGRLAPLFFVIIGFFVTISIFNYIPGGILLFGIVVLWMLLFQKRYFNYLCFLFGVIIGILIYHYTIHSLYSYGLTFYDLFFKVQSIPPDGAELPNHSVGNLIRGFVVFLIKCIAIMGSTFCLALFAQNRLLSLIKSVLIKSLVGIGVTIVLFIVLYLIKEYIGTTIFLIPSAIVIAQLAAIRKFEKKELKLIFVFLLLMIVPMLGIFGTNQPYERKTLLFTVFWIIGYWFLVVSYQKNISKRVLTYTQLLFCGIVLVAFMCHGFNYRAHSYYGIRKASYYLENTARYQNIKVHPYQKQYIENINDLLLDNGFVPGDTLVCFDIHQVVAYIVGTAVPDEIIYFSHHKFMFIGNKLSFTPSYLLLFTGMEENFLDYLEENDSAFNRGNYSRIPAGRYAENLPDSFSSVLYIKQ